jgi:hypothetical protein
MGMRNPHDPAKELWDAYSENAKIGNRSDAEYYLDRYFNLLEKKVTIKGNDKNLVQ